MLPNDDIKKIIKQVCREIDVDRSRIQADFDENKDLWTFDIKLGSDKCIRLHLDSGDIEQCLAYNNKGHGPESPRLNERCAG